MVAYDQDNGMYASRLWWLLRWMGHGSVAVLDGGLAKWIGENRPLQSGIETPTRPEPANHPVSVPAPARHQLASSRSTQANADAHCCKPVANPSGPGETANGSP